MMRKKTAYYFCIVLLATSTFAKVAINDIRQNSCLAMLDFTIDNYRLENVIVNGENNTKIIIDGDYYNNLKKGAPVLPFSVTNVAIPNNTEVSIKIVNIETEEITVSKIMPSRGAVPISKKLETVPYFYGDEYKKNSYLPKTSVSLSEPFIMRDIRGVAVKYFPFQYNPITHKLLITKKITISIVVKDTSKRDFAVEKRLPKSSSFEALYKNIFINYSSNESRIDDISDGEKMVIITDSTFKSAVIPLAEWKKRKGIATEISVYPTETGGEGKFKLRDFIREKYKEGAVYFLLVGDIEYIPSLVSGGLWSWTGAPQSGKVDPKFAMLEGYDYYLDAFIGRFSVKTPMEAKRFADRVIKYEKEPNANANWYNRAVGAASIEGTPPAIETMNILRDCLLSNTFTTVSKVYEPSGTTANLAGYVNDGISLLNYIGHGLTDQWHSIKFKNSNVKNLNNGDKLPVVFSVACIVGKFDIDSDCFAEVWTKRESGGAISFYGSSISQPSDAPQIALKDIIKNYTSGNYRTIGPMIVNGLVNMIGAASKKSESDPYITTAISWHLFGDPSLTPFSDKPKPITITHPDIASNNFMVTGDSGVIVCVYDSSNSKLIVKEINENKTALFDLTDYNGDKIFITATNRNSVPYLSEISPVSGTFIIGSDEKKIDPNNLSISTKNVSGTLQFNLPKPGIYTISIYTISGRKLITSTKRYNSTGKQMINFKKQHLSSGLYIVSLKGVAYGVVKPLIIK